MRREKIIDLGHLTVRVKELTVGELRNLLKNEDLVIDIPEFLRGNSGLPPEIVEVFCDLKREQIEALTFSEVKAIINGIKEVNSDFFDVIEMLGTFAGMLEGARHRKSSTESSSHSQGPASTAS